MLLARSLIRSDGGTQPRAAIEFMVVKEYAEAMEAGASFPPPVVFYDGSAYWLADGFHRVKAHADCGHDKIECDVRQGTLRDAVLHSLSANATHGIPRTPTDRRRVVTRMLSDEEWSQWSDRAIAEHCGVGAELVGKVRRELAPEVFDSNTSKRKGKDGKEYKTTAANQAKGGKASAAARKKKAAEKAPPPAEEFADPEEAVRDSFDADDRSTYHDAQATAAAEAAEEPAFPEASPPSAAAQVALRACVGLATADEWRWVARQVNNAWPWRK